MKRWHLFSLLFYLGFSGAIKASEISIHAEQKQSEECSEVTESLTDLLLSLTPGVSWGKSICEAVSGKRLITGKKLTEFERKLAIIQAVAAGHGLGIGTVCTTIDIIQSCERLSPQIISYNNT